MNEYTTHKYVVATKRANRVFTMFTACDSLDDAYSEFDRFNQDTHPHIEQVAIFTRGQWNGRRNSMRYHKNLKTRADAIPSVVGMWLVNQADAGYF